MISAQSFFTDSQGSFMKSLSWGVLALGSKEQRQVIETGGGIGMIYSECLLTDGQ